FQAEDGIRDDLVTGVQTCALPIYLQKALWNTVVLAFWVGLASLAIGSPIAWLTARTDLPGKRLIRGLILASFVTPPFLGAFAWEIGRGACRGSGVGVGGDGG